MTCQYDNGITLSLYRIFIECQSLFNHIYNFFCVKHNVSLKWDSKIFTKIFYFIYLLRAYINIAFKVEM